MSEFFPDGNIEALTMLYLQNQDLSETSPERLAELYWETYYRVSDASKEARKGIRDSRKG